MSLIINTGLYRKKVREALALAPDWKFTEEMILDAVNDLVPQKLTLEQLRTCIEWNHSSGYIDFTFNREAERDEWFLTPRGKALQ